MKTDKTKIFSDLVDEFNKLAKANGFSSGRAWANKAAKRNQISKSYLIKIENILDLRNTVNHGNSQYVNITEQAINDVREILRRMNGSDSGNYIKNSNKQKSFIKMPSGTFRSKPFFKDFYRKGSDGENYHFKFVIKKESYSGYSIYIKEAPHFDTASWNPHEFHILDGASSNPYICWSESIENFQEANAVMFVWVNRYVKTLDAFKHSGKVKEKKYKNKNIELPTGTFRAF